MLSEEERDLIKALDDETRPDEDGEEDSDEQDGVGASLIGNDLGD